MAQGNASLTLHSSPSPPLLPLPSILDPPALSLLHLSVQPHHRFTKVGPSGIKSWFQTLYKPFSLLLCSAWNFSSVLKLQNKVRACFRRFRPLSSSQNRITHIHNVHLLLSLGQHDLGFPSHVSFHYFERDSPALYFANVLPHCPSPSTSSSLRARTFWLLCAPVKF